MGLFRLTPGIRNIIVITFAVYVLDCVLTGIFTHIPGTPYLVPNFLGRYLGLVALPLHDPLTTFAQIWRPFTYMLVHADFWHVFWNMLGLFFLGTAVEETIGTRRLYRLYLASGVAGGLLAIAAGFLDPAPLTLGASGAVLGVVIAFCTLLPQVTVLIWFLIPVKAKYVGYAYAFFQLWGALTSGPDAGVSFSAHIGGMICGFMMARNRYWFEDVQLPKTDFKRRWRRRHLRAVPARKATAAAGAGAAPMATVPDPPVPRTPLTDLEGQVDAILDKVRTSGMDALSPDERRTLDLHATRLRQRDTAR